MPLIAKQKNAELDEASLFFVAAAPGAFVLERELLGVGRLERGAIELLLARDGEVREGLAVAEKARVNVSIHQAG